MDGTTRLITPPAPPGLDRPARTSGDDGDILEGQRNRSLGFVDDNFHRVHPGIGHHIVGDLPETVSMRFRGGPATISAARWASRP